MHGACQTRKAQYIIARPLPFSPQDVAT